MVTQGVIAQNTIVFTLHVVSTVLLQLPNNPPRNTKGLPLSYKESLLSSIIQRREAEKRDDWEGRQAIARGQVREVQGQHLQGVQSRHAGELFALLSVLGEVGQPPVRISFWSKLILWSLQGWARMEAWSS